MKYSYPNLISSVTYNVIEYKIIIFYPVINIQHLYTHTKEVWYNKPMLQKYEFPFFEVDKHTFILMYPWRVEFESTTRIGYPNVEKYV